MSTGRRKMRRPRLNADALIEACQDLLDSGALGTKHQQRPHVLVTVDAAEYRAGLGGLLHLPGTDAEPITAATVDQYLCDADVTTILTRPAEAGASSTTTRDDAYGWLHDAAREVLYVGRTRRTAPPRLRKALAIRDQHCVFPGCRVDPSRCDAHHVTEWVDDGLTDPSNMLLLCRSHHTVVHKAGWTITRTTRLPRRPTRRLGLHAPTTTKALSRGRRDQGAPPLIRTPSTHPTGSRTPARYPAF